jgi:hypothetical protein
VVNGAVERVALTRPRRCGPADRGLDESGVLGGRGFPAHDRARAGVDDERDIDEHSRGQLDVGEVGDEQFWILAGITVMIAFGDALTLLALAFAIATMTTAWWIYRKVEHRVERNDAEMAPVSHFRPALTGQRDLKKTSAHASWRGPSAAA